jgi:hypothetical protein
VITHAITPQSIEPEQPLQPMPKFQTPWRLGLVTDSAGHVHLGAMVPTSAGRPDLYIDLLAPVGAGGVANLDLGRLSVIVQGERLADLHRIIATCVDDVRLRHGLLDLVALSGAQR